MQQVKQKPTITIRPDWLTVFFSQVIDYGAKLSSTTKRIDLSGFRNLFNNFPHEKFKNILNFVRKPQVVLALVTLVILTAGVVFIRGKVSSNPQVFGNSQTNFSPQITSVLNRKFEIPIRNASGKETGTRLPITITTVDAARRILIQGKPATSRDGKTFLILNMDIDNSTTNQLSIRPVDFIRLVDSQGKSFAPDVHNEVVKAEPVSVKKTRVGFVVDESQKQFKFLIGEIGGQAETVEITL